MRQNCQSKAKQERKTKEKRRRIMKRICLILVAVCVALPAMALENFNAPFEPDEYTMGLWHFDGEAGDTMVLDAGP